jgi:hypothetical protein
VKQAQPQGPGRTLFRTLLISAAIALGACSGAGHGDDTVVAPTAVVTPLNYKAVSASPVTIEVRSGADVQLSGKDSFSGNISITTFAWQQTDAAPKPQVTLLYRNANTISFTAPQVAQPVTLNFQLTVTNASGRTSMATAQVNVAVSNDPDRFLLASVTPPVPPVPKHFRAGVSTVAGLANLSADAPVCVQLSRTISYTPRSGAANSGSIALPAVRVDAKWVAAVGGAAGFTPGDFTNPVVSFVLPSLNDDDILAKYGGPGADVNPLTLVPSDVDSAYLQMAVSAAPGSCDGTASNATLSASTLMLQLYDETGAPVGTPATASAAGSAVSINSSPLNPDPLTPDGSSNLTPDDFLRAVASRLVTAAPANNPVHPVYETRESATAYYAAIDPPSGGTPSAKSTLPGWLAANCFDANDPNYGAGETGFSVAHAVYTNNFDLGFGRDMYFSKCANGTMASVVINYPTLEAAANKLGAFLAVAMEYTPGAGSSAPCFTNIADPTTNTGSCFATFYSFAPDDRTGVFQRILSANFDRRGQKYLPGSCTACHGGTPAFAPGQPYPSNGRIDANFLPWDVGTLLFGDTDPAFSCIASNQNPNCASVNAAQYTQATQEPLIQQMNALAWRTFQYVELISPAPGAPAVDRNQAPRDLLTQWYGGDPGASTAHAFDDTSTPAAWMTPGQTAAAPGDLYHAVFAHYCRSCHTEVSAPSLQFASYAQFANALPFVPHLGLGAVTGAVYGDAEMPLSRLTMDRFWSDFDGGTSAAQTLATFVNGVAGAPKVAVDTNNDVIGSGAPQVMLLNPATTPESTVTTTAPVTVTGLQGLALDAVSKSVFVANYQWSLCLGGPPATPGGPCPGTSFGVIGTPLVPSGSSAAAAETGASIPAFSTSVPGTYFLTLNASDGALGATPTQFVYQFIVN